MTEKILHVATKEMAVTKKKNNDTFKAHVTSLKEGDKAPNFEAKDQDGTTVRLSDFSGTLVLYFYPKDDTPTCTSQACNLRDEYQDLVRSKYQVVGVSADDVTTHGKFIKKYALPFPLLADTDMAIIRAYDVWGQKMLFGRIYDGIVRTTFILENGYIRRVITDVNSKQHVRQILENT